MKKLLTCTFNSRTPAVVGAFVVAATALASGCAVNGVDAAGSAEEGALPKEPSRAQVAERGPTPLQAQVRAHYQAQRDTLRIRATTTTASGQVIDWVEPESQQPDGSPLAEPPPMPEDIPELDDPARFEIELAPEASGPPGTVPIVRMDSKRLLDQLRPEGDLADYFSKYGDARDLTSPEASAPEGALRPMTTSTNRCDHFYATTIQTLLNYGTEGTLYVPNPYVWRSDEFSLGQLALQRGKLGAKQTIEAGWQRYRERYGDDLPHLFIFYTTDGYNSQQNYKGGYNREVAGWRQVSATHFPAGVLATGSQLYLRVRYWDNNWWLFVNSEWMGYYPATLFATTGLRNFADQAKWFGEVADFRDGLTTYTAMGNSRFAAPGAAFMRNLRVETASSVVPYTPEYTKPTKPGCYTIEPHYNSGSSWGSYFYFGGPGKWAPSCL